jgi:hypothetical protein
MGLTMRRCGQRFGAGTSPRSGPTQHFFGNVANVTVYATDFPGPRRGYLRSTPLSFWVYAATKPVVEACLGEEDEQAEQNCNGEGEG